MTRLLAGLVAVLTLVAGFFRLRSQQHKAESQRDRQRAAVAEGAAATHRRATKTRRKTQDRHRQEDRDAKRKHTARRRDHLDNDW
jgi:hypothetical protein